MHDNWKRLPDALKLRHRSTTVEEADARPSRVHIGMATNLKKIKNIDLTLRVGVT